jgi:eukaryotic-like serine/threonine-protein kinase
MRLEPGASVGPYQITAHLGSGGMGDVYRARDPKLQRDVAIKVLPEAFAADPDRVARFEREALAVATLSHPGILSIHDFGKAGGQTYAVMELLDGETLRHRLETSPIPARRAIEIAAQIARALAAAHGKGIVHRDIKPENIFLTADGRVKVLDFGRARLDPGLATGTSASTATRLDTAAGVVLGTVGYMSPEQVRGLAVDARSDIFSLGVVLYELLAGARPFRGDSAVETMNAILTQDPPPLAVADAALGPALTGLVEHCLEKEPAGRFQSAQDLAFNLEALRGRSDRASGQTVTPAGVPARRRGALVPLMAVAATMLVAGAVVGAWLWRGAAAATPPIFLRLTYDTGIIWNARFTPDGQNVVFGGAWNGGPIRAFLSRTDRVGATALSLPDASVHSVSKTGELAVSLGHGFDGWMGEGTLARTALFSGAPRVMVERVREAEWTPDGSDLAIVRRMSGLERLEFPIGTVLYQTNGYISHIRFSHDGQRIAFVDHPLYADDNGDIAVVDRAGTKTTLASGYQGARGLAWSRDDREVWYTAAAQAPSAGVELSAATLDGRRRSVLALPTDWRIMDIAADGRVLITGETVLRHIELWRDGEAQPKDFALFDQSLGGALSSDGMSALIADQGSQVGTTYATYLRRADQQEAVRLGEGQAVDFSSDGQWALSLIYGPPSRLLLLPVGAGKTVELPNPDKLTIQAAAFVPGRRQVVLVAGEGREQNSGYVQDLDTGAMRAFTGKGMNPATYNTVPISPDGARVWLEGPDGRSSLYPIAGGKPAPLPGVEPGERVIRWTGDGGAIFVSNFRGMPQRIVRVDIATGRRTPVKELMPAQISGVRRTEISMTPDGRSVLFSYSRLLASLYVVTGLK